VKPAPWKLESESEFAARAKQAALTEEVAGGRTLRVFKK